MATYYDGYDWDTDGFPGQYVYGDYEYVDDYYMDERWKPTDVRGYWVSNKGRVWSSIQSRFIEGHTTKKGYVDFSFKINGHRVRRYLHRLLAEAFIPNPRNYSEVRHLDDNAYNNELENLAWGTQLDNTRDCIRNGHFRFFTREDIELANSIRRTPVIAIRLRDGKRYRFVSQQEASRQLGVDQASINAVVRGKCRSACGYYFVREDEFDGEFNHVGYTYQKRGMPIKAINMHTDEIRIYDRPRQAAIALGLSESSISNILHGKALYSKGWIFEELDAEEYDEYGY